MLLFLGTAFAIDGAFDCATWTSAADVWPQASALDFDDSVYGARATGVYSQPHAEVLDIVLSYVESGCPYYNDGGDLLVVSGRETLNSSCTTTAGDLIEWSRTPEGYNPDDAQLGSWDVTITPASGSLVSLNFQQVTTGSRVNTHDGSRFDIDTWTWSATWSGHLADGWPDDGWVSLEGTEDYEEDYLDGSWSQDYAFTWASPTCEWSLDFAQDYDGPLLTSWIFNQGSQTLTVSGSEADTCGLESVDVDLDGVAGTAASDGWTSLTDADGDGYCLEVDDCRDGTAAIHPGVFDRPYDHIDQDCSGADLTDVDGDGYDSVRVGGSDCNDASRRVNPAARDLRVDGIDQDCDGVDGR